MLLAIYPTLPAQDASKVDAEESRILALDNAWNKAEERKDAKALDELLASSLVYIDYDGTLMNKSQFLASIKVPSLHPEQIINESMNVNMYGTSAIVTGFTRREASRRAKLTCVVAALPTPG